MIDTESTATFELPPRVRTATGEVRRAGFEFEYNGLDLHQTAEIVREVFGGQHKVLSTFQHEVHSPLGTFGIEIDTSVLKDRRYEKVLRRVGVEPEKFDLIWLEEALLGVARTVVPIEVAAPPLPITDLRPLEELRARLQQAGAKGTRASLLYAYGMHINPQIASDDPAELLNVLRAFVLLHPWLKDKSEVDLTRSISPYIDRFPSEYCRLILRPDYPATAGRLIDDYLAWNNTRNRALDLLPVLAHLDRERVLRQVEDPHLVKARPAFHYRLPNCMVDEPGWTLAAEWNRWVAVERLAEDKERLAAMARDYLAAEEESFRPFYDKWPSVLEGHLGEGV